MKNAANDARMGHSEAGDMRTVWLDAYSMLFAGACVSLLLPIVYLFCCIILPILYILHPIVAVGSETFLSQRSTADRDEIILF